MNDAPRIDPRTRIGELLEAHPELEDVLVSLSPAFEKLRHPMLRRTVARVATLESAARVAGLDPGELVNALRRAIGAAADATTTTERSSPADVDGGGFDLPELLDAPVAETIDADAVLDAGEHPAAAVERALKAAPEGSVVALVASFRPEPLLERLAERGASVHVAAPSEDRASDRAATTRVLIRARRRGTTSPR